MVRKLSARGAPEKRLEVDISNHFKGSVCLPKFFLTFGITLRGIGLS